jgi:hypothetical protein
MFTGKILKLLSFNIAITAALLIILSGVQSRSNPVYSEEPGLINIKECSDSADMELLQCDPVLTLLGKSFSEVKEILGEPQEEGFSTWNGPHNYMLFELEEGSIRFCSPLGLGNNYAVSIVAGREQEILGARVGMSFSEIESILGEPDFGPEPGIGNMYYMDYYFGITDNQAPQYFISFYAADINSPTLDVFIKWEAYPYENPENYMQSKL